MGGKEESISCALGANVDTLYRAGDDRFVEGEK